MMECPNPRIITKLSFNAAFRTDKTRDKRLSALAPHKSTAVETTIVKKLK
jgi:hypothetical protein